METIILGNGCDRKEQDSKTGHEIRSCYDDLQIDKHDLLGMQTLLW